MLAYYAARAREYERIYDPPERQADLERLRLLVEGLFVGSRVLEVACGTGYWTRILARAAAAVMATDGAEAVLDVARAKGLDPRKVSFRREDAFRLPVFPERFDAGLAGFWWSHVPKRRLPGFLRGFHRALAPGARVLFFDNVYVEGGSTAISRVDEFGDSYQTRRLSDGTVHEVRKNFPTEPELRTAVGEAGEALQVEFLRHYWILSYRVA